MERSKTVIMAHNDVSAAQTAPVHVKMVLFTLALGGFAIGTTEFATMSLLPYFAKDLGIDEPTAGHVISIYALGVVVGAPLLVFFSSWLSRRVLRQALMVVFALAHILCAFAPSYGWMMLFRFMSGLPHGAYFGIAALVAVSIVPRNRRTQAVARAMLGLTVATIIGVPLANWLGQTLNWRWGFILVSVLAFATAFMAWLFAPDDKLVAGNSALREFAVLKRGQVWLTLAMVAIGAGGLFAVYTYLASTLMEVTQAAPSMVPVVFSVFGVGMTLGTLCAGWAADKALMPTIGFIFLWQVIALALFPAATQSIWFLVPVVFLIGCGSSVGTAMQARLMDVSGDTQTLTAALNHSAFNMANALGPWFAGMAIAAGYGFASTGWVGSALAAGGLLLWIVALLTSQGTSGKRGDLRRQSKASQGALLE